MSQTTPVQFYHSHESQQTSGVDRGRLHRDRPGSDGGAGRERVEGFVARQKPTLDGQQPSFPEHLGSGERQRKAVPPGEYLLGTLHRQTLSGAIQEYTCSDH